MLRDERPQGRRILAVELIEGRHNDVDMGQNPEGIVVSVSDKPGFVVDFCAGVIFGDELALSRPVCALGKYETLPEEEGVQPVLDYRSLKPFGRGVSQLPTALL